MVREAAEAKRGVRDAPHKQAAVLWVINLRLDIIADPPVKAAYHIFIDQQRSTLRHAPGATAGADLAPVTTESHQALMMIALAAHT